ncbi:unnamed protein product [Mytilus edulis]|uniref:Uncharacterized protein n=1 Tax=Mytilus edulis TaxID=6550 RepID=A0A8S3RL31_MYTED|nr:unnamed protein product [Mytilus edulis]
MVNNNSVEGDCSTPKVLSLDNETNQQKSAMDPIKMLDNSLIIKEIDTLVLDNDNNNNDHNLLDPNSPLLKGVNETVSKVSSMLYNAAFVGNAKSEGKKGMKRRKIKKPYYDGECETMYRNVKCLSRRFVETPWDKTLRLYVLQQKKEYNKLVRKKYRNVRQKVLDNILEAEKRNPQEFWKAINTLKSNTNSDPSSNITHQEWFEYFKKLMNVNQNDNFSNDNKFIDQFNSDILNYDMTTEEVIKISCLVNTDIYVKLFNLIFKSGIYPAGWRENFIKPIFKGGCFNDPSNYRGVALSSCLGKNFTE